MNVHTKWNYLIPILSSLVKYYLFQGSIYFCRIRGKHSVPRWSVWSLFTMEGPTPSAARQLSVVFEAASRPIPSPSAGLSHTPGVWFRHPESDQARNCTTSWRPGVQRGGQGALPTASCSYSAGQRDYEVESCLLCLRQIWWTFSQQLPVYRTKVWPVDHGHTTEISHTQNCINGRHQEGLSSGIYSEERSRCSAVSVDLCCHQRTTRSTSFEVQSSWIFLSPSTLMISLVELRRRKRPTRCKIFPQD